MDPMIAIIMGGGAGTRLFPLTQNRSKPAVPLAGKYRLIDIPISNCLNSQIRRIFVLTQFNSASLNRHIAVSYTFDRFSQGFVTIMAAEQTPYSQKWFQGTADAVRQSLHHVDAYYHSHILILSGDHLYLMNYQNMFRHHIENKAEITIGTYPVCEGEASDFGILQTDKNNVITRFCEKPPQNKLAGLESKVTPELQAQGRHYLASMGIYIFDRKILKEELDANPTFTDFGKEVIPNAISRRRVVSFPFTGYWSDIGTIQAFYEAHLQMTKPNSPLDFYHPKMPIFTHTRMLAPTRIEKSKIENALLTESCVIQESEISDSVIGIRSVIAPKSIIRNSILMGADYYPWQEKTERAHQEGADTPGVGAGSILDKVIVDKNVSVGKNCVITNQAKLNHADGENYYIRDGIIILPKNAAIPDGTVI